MAKLDIDLVGIIIKGHGVCLIFVVKGLEEGTSKLANFMELRVDVTENRISLEKRCPDKVSVSAAIIKFGHSKVVLVRLGLLPHTVLVIS
jgi:hypothetical protein